MVSVSSVVVGVPFFNHLDKGICLKAGFSGTVTLSHSFCPGSSLCSQSSWQNSFVCFCPPLCSPPPKSFTLGRFIAECGAHSLIAQPGG